MIHDYEFENSGGTAVSLTSTGDKFVFTPNVPIDIVEWGVVLTTALDATLRTIALDKRVTAGSDSGRVNAVGTTTISGSAAVVAGKQLYARPTSPVQINPGEQAVIEVTDAAVAGAGVFYVKFQRRAAPSQNSRMANATTVN